MNNTMWGMPIEMAVGLIGAASAVLGALLGAAVGGVITWRASERASSREVAGMLQATQDAAAAAVRLSRLERVEPVVEHLSNVVQDLVTAVGSTDQRIDDVPFVDALGRTWLKTADLCPQFSRLLRELHGAAAHWLRNVEWQPDPRHGRVPTRDWCEHTIVPLLAISDLCNEWFRDPDAFEGRGPVSVNDLLAETVRIRRAPIDASIPRPRRPGETPPKVA